MAHEHEVKRHRHEPTITRHHYPDAIRPLVIHEALAHALLTGSFVAWGLVEAPWFLPRVLDRLRGRTRGARRDRGSVVVVSVTIAVGLSLALRLAHDGGAARLPGPGWLAVVVGLAVLWAGVLFRAWAIVTLGRFFQPVVTVEAGQPVIDTGPYRFVRHPSYTGALIAFAGLAIALDTWLALPLAVLLPAAGLAFRIAVEERALRTGLGERYERYAQRTRRLVPGVW